MWRSVERLNPPATPDEYPWKFWSFEHSGLIFYSMADAQDILLFVASSTGQNGYTYELGQPIELDDDVERVTMSIKDLNVPFSWWNTVGRGFRLYTTASPSTGWYTYTMNGAYDPGYIREYRAELCNTNGWRSLIDGK